MSPHLVSGLVLDIFPGSTIYSSQQSDEVDIIIIPILQMRKMRPGQVKCQPGVTPGFAIRQLDCRAHAPQMSTLLLGLKMSVWY